MCVGGGGGGALNKVLYGEAPPQGPTPYPFIYSGTTPYRDLYNTDISPWLVQNYKEDIKWNLAERATHNIFFLQKKMWESPGFFFYFLISCGRCTVTWILLCSSQLCANIIIDNITYSSKCGKTSNIGKTNNNVGTKQFIIICFIKCSFYLSSKHSYYNNTPHWTSPGAL